MTRSRSLLVCVCAVLLAASFAAAQVPPSAPVPATVPPAPAPAVTPPPAPSPVQSMRSKLSAGDLESAEDILEVHRAQHGEDGKHLLGLSWLARGAMLVGRDFPHCGVAKIRSMPRGHKRGHEEAGGRGDIRTKRGKG